jgi:hypothetical protein
MAFITSRTWNRFVFPLISVHACLLLTGGKYVTKNDRNRMYRLPLPCKLQIQTQTNLQYCSSLFFSDIFKGRTEFFWTQRRSAVAQMSNTSRQSVANDYRIAFRICLFLWHPLSFTNVLLLIDMTRIATLVITASAERKIRRSNFDWQKWNSKTFRVMVNMVYMCAH